MTFESGSASGICTRIAALSVGFSQLEAARKYVAGQEEHHRKVSFQDEFRAFLRRYELEFDERYLWD
jgi:hypothetical protein